MPFGAVQLIPGVNTEKTPTLNQAGVSQSQLIRYRDGLVQKLGGWSKFYPFTLSGVPRDLHAWEDLNGTNHLGYGSTRQLGIITNSSYLDITPQTLTSDLAPAFQATANSTAVLVTDPNISNVTVYDSILFNTPMSAGGTVLSGIYPIVQITGVTSYIINTPTAALTTNTLTTNATTAIGSTVLNFTAVPSWVTTGMIVIDLSTANSLPADTTVVSTTATSITLSAAAVHSTLQGDAIVITSLPRFGAISGSANVNVELVSHGLATTTNDAIIFPLSTTNASAGITISGRYPPISITNSSTFVITVPNQSATTIFFDMNGGLAELVYYINLGPPAGGSGFGLGGFGLGGFGTGNTQASQTGTEITPTDWTLDNWGQLLIAAPMNGGVYTFDPLGGFLNAMLINTAPIFNGGLFVSTALQILVCWGTTVSEKIGIQQDPLLVKWSTLGDFTVFTPLVTNQAGSFRIPNGSKIMGGASTPNQNLIWTDLDLWAMNYQGPPFVFGFNKIGAGAGLISAHAHEQLRGAVYWMGLRNFYVFDANGGVKVLPCPVWDFVFQNLNTTYVSKIRALANTPFNEVGWAFPSAASTGENDSYVKFNITEPNNPWDFGTLSRSAAIDQTILGTPIQATPDGIIYQQETSNDADGQPLAASFTTGFFYIAEGEEFAFVDQIYPDFKFGTYSGSQTAQMQLSFNVVGYPGDTPTVYGPYTVMATTQFIPVRFRGRQMSITIQSSDVGSFWRIGRVRYRYAPVGRR